MKWSHTFEFDRTSRQGGQLLIQLPERLRRLVLYNNFAKLREVPGIKSHVSLYSLYFFLCESSI